jgi:hypothetical protein
VELKDLKVPKKTKKELKEMTAPILGEPDKYPYGMRLTFDTELMTKFPELEKVKAGDKVNLSGVGEVIMVRKVDRQGDKKQDYSTEIQIQKLGVEPPKKDTLIGAIERSKKGLK